MNDCLFCKIIRGEIPAESLYQDEVVVAFRDINPQAPVHVLIVPKQHVADLMEPDAAQGALLSGVYRAVQKLAVQLGLESGFRVVANCGKDGGQTVYHIHFHLLGRRTMAWPPG
jgi:histidine triad (HIT) family protein